MARVLIVDDERSIRETLSEFVKEIGYEVFVACEADEAIRVVSTSKPDVVVCDIVLPGMDGMGLLERIHHVSPETQVIMVTGEPTVETASDAVRQGAFDYLAKPVSSNEIQAAVESAVRVKQMSDERSRLEEENRRLRDHLEEEVERKARALADSERRYRILVETANEAVVVSQDESITFANPKTEEITGYSMEELVGMPASELVHPEDREMVDAFSAKRSAGEEAPSAYVFRLIHATGETKSLEVRPILIDWEGRPAILNMASDVTERVRAQAEIRASEKKWRELFENLRDGWVSIDMDGCILECNRAYADMLGYSTEELPSRTYQELTPERWYEQEESIVESIVGRGYSGVYQKEYIRKDGTIFPVEISSYLRRNETGDAIGMWGLARDITARVRAEQELAEGEARYRTLFEDSPVSLWYEDFSSTKTLLDELRKQGVTDLEAYIAEHPEFVDACIQGIRVVDVNEATLEMHGASTKGELETSLGGILTETSRGDFTRQLLTIWDGRSSFEGTTVDRTLTGEEKHVVIRWSVPPGHEENYDRVFVSKLDITPTVLAERAFREALSGTVEAIGLTTEMRDPYTAGHQRRVTALAVAIARKLKLDEETVEGIRAAGLMHDIGKMGVPAEILSKPSGLTDVEMSLIRAHPQVAYDILKAVSFPWPLAEIVLQHHERLDGKGYPRGLSGGEIRLEAKILSVADTVEAMASHRPYRAALGIDVALAQIETDSGAAYEPEVVDVCIRLFRESEFTFPESETEIGV